MSSAGRATIGISLPRAPSPDTQWSAARNAPAATARWIGKAFRIMPASVIPDRKSTRLNSSHANISYAVFCLKKKKTYPHDLDSQAHDSHADLSYSAYLSR